MKSPHFDRFETHPLKTATSRHPFFIAVAPGKRAPNRSLSPIGPARKMPQNESTQGLTTKQPLGELGIISNR